MLIHKKSLGILAGIYLGGNVENEVEAFFDRDPRKHLNDSDNSIKVYPLDSLADYLQNHKITVEDLNLLTNGRATSINEAWVNGVKVVNSGDPAKKKIDYDVTCKNGYIQKVEHVIESSPNMALIIHKPSRLIE